MQGSVDYLNLGKRYKRVKHAKSRKYRGVFKVKSRIKTRQILEIWSQQLEHKQFPKRGTEPDVRKGKRSLLACHTRCKCSMETKYNTNDPELTLLSTVTGSSFRFLLLPRYGWPILATNLARRNIYNIFVFFVIYSNKIIYYCYLFYSN